MPDDRSALVRFATRLVAAASPSGAEGDVAALVEEEMRRLGYQVGVDELGNVVGKLEVGPGPVILLDAHMDTVGVTDPDLWEHSPGGEIAEGRLYGRGAMDMKGPLASAIHGVATLKDAGIGTYVVSATVAEEMVEGTALGHVVESTNPDVVVICEATSLKIAHGQRGRAEIIVETFGTPTHSSRPELGVNALDMMNDALLELRRLELPRHEVLGPAILVATDVMSRPYPALSVVPDYCVATLDRRTLPGESEEELLGSIREALASVNGRGGTARAAIAEDDFATYTNARVHAPNFAPAWYFPPDAHFVRRASAGLAAAGVDHGLTTYAFCTNGSATAGRAGIPTLGYGPGDEERAHRTDEFIELADLAEAERGYPAICRALADQEGPWV